MELLEFQIRIGEHWELAKMLTIGDQVFPILLNLILVPSGVTVRSSQILKGMLGSTMIVSAIGNLSTATVRQIDQVVKGLSQTLIPSVVMEVIPLKRTGLLPIPGKVQDLQQVLLKRKKYGDLGKAGQIRSITLRKEVAVNLLLEGQTQINLQVPVTIAQRVLLHGSLRKVTAVLPGSPQKVTVHLPGLQSHLLDIDLPQDQVPAEALG